MKKYVVTANGDIFLWEGNSIQRRNEETGEFEDILLLREKYLFIFYSDVYYDVCKSKHMRDYATVIFLGDPLARVIGRFNTLLDAEICCFLLYKTAKQNVHGFYMKDMDFEKELCV